MQALTDNNIDTFAAAVRAELADLPKREIQELTDGLEADLAERFAEEGADFKPGSAAEYAAELREAAGIAPKPAKGKAFSSQAFVENVQDWFRKTKFGTAILEFGISVRPVWWLLRAVIAWTLFAFLFYDFNGGLPLLPVFMLLSVQWGRKKWFSNKFFTSILLPLNLLALVLTVPATNMLIQKFNGFTQADLMMQQWAATDGLRLNGEPITEIKAFDSSDQEVLGLTFKDQAGNPIQAGVSSEEFYRMPDIIGMNIEEANLALGQAGIPGADFEYLEGADESNGVVVRVEPSTPGDLVGANDIVIVTIGKK